MSIRSILLKTGRVLLSPIRRWRITLAVVLLLAAAHVVLDQVLLSKLASQREAIRAAGGHLSFRDFWLNLDDSNNAAVVYRYAKSSIRLPRDRPGWDDSLPSQYVRSRLNDCAATEEPGSKANADRQPLTPEQESLVAEALTANAHVYDLLKEARGRPNCQFGNYESALVDEQADPSLIVLNTGIMRELSRWAALRAVWEAEHGNVDRGYEWIATGLHMANALCNDPLLLTGLERVGCIAIMLDALEAIVCRHPAPDPLPEGFVKELERAGDRAGNAVFFEGERCFSNGSCAAMRRQSGRLMRPFMLTPNQIHINDLLSQVTDALTEPDFLARRAKCAALETPKVKLKSGFWYSLTHMHRILADLLRPAMSRSITSFERALAMAAMARQAIALKQYKAAHGEYPPDLHALTPEFMKDLPLDPFSGKPFQYRREGEGVVLYSLWDDFKDDGGKPWDKTTKKGDYVWCCTR